jgi:hypothetical protein
MRGLKWRQLSHKMMAIKIDIGAIGDDARHAAA